MQNRVILRVIVALMAVVGLVGLDAGLDGGLAKAAPAPFTPPEAAHGGTNRPPANGVRRSEPNWYALVDATLHPRPGETIEHAVILIRDGRIVGVTRGGEGSTRVPLGPTPIQVTGMHVYAGFIEPWLEIEAPQPAMDAASEHFLKNVTPQRRASTGDWGSSAASLRKMGFAAAGIAPKVGVFRGKGAVVSLAEAPEEASLPRPPMLLEDAFHAISFDRRSEGYPDSLMGAIALVRQTLFDEAWQRERREAGIDTGPLNAIDALRPAVGEGNASRAVPLYFDTEDELDALRSLKIGEEFERPVVIVGSGMEFRRLGGDGRDGLAGRILADDSRRSGRPGLIVPLAFPEEPDVETPGKAEAVEMRSLMAWEQAPTNPKRLAQAGVAFALTSGKGKDRGNFMKNLRLAIACGLSEDDALAALTTNAARVLDVGDELGTVESGKRANLVVCDGPIFAKKTKVRDVWIDGRRHVITPPMLELEGTWDVTLPAGWAAPGDWPHTLEAASGGGLTLKREKVEGKEGGGIDAASVSCEKVQSSPASFDARRGTIEFVFDRAAFAGEGNAGVVVVSASVDLSENPPTMRGVVVQPDGTRVEFSASRRPPMRVVGTWRVVEADGKPVAEDDPKAPVIEIAGLGDDSRGRDDDQGHGRQGRCDACAVHV
ncbi:MAG: amidohydrolase family protein [Phycisphaerales bacterium]|nr:MAG: amidohydrolase family protein [Phycisphaerales bacterium]